MGGEIGVDSAVGSGSIFWFTVVLDTQAPAVALPNPAPPAVSQTAADQPGVPQSDNSPAMSAPQRAFMAALRRTGRSSAHILLVEDNLANLRVTQALLEAIGCNVVAAHNGLEAVDAYRQDSFDLILMDCQMPEMDGYEAAKAIRQLEKFSQHSTPIVALTAHALDGSREASLAAGMNDHLTKPLTMAALTMKLVQWLGEGSVAEVPGA